MLSLKAAGSLGETLSDQSVAIAVPRPGSRDVVVALAEPGKPTKILSDTKKDTSAATTAIAPDAVLIRSVEAQQRGGFFASGAGAAGKQVRLYLNDAFVAAVKVGPDGRWSVTVEKGMAAGDYAVRADLVSADDGKVLARSEVAFAYPAAIASAPAPISELAAAPAPARLAADDVAGADAVVADLRTAKVERGDSLWRISRVMLGRGVRYTQIYDANTTQIRNPRLIYPGQVLVVPSATP